MERVDVSRPPPPPPPPPHPHTHTHTNDGEKKSAVTKGYASILKQKQSDEIEGEILNAGKVGRGTDEVLAPFRSKKKHTGQN